MMKNVLVTGGAGFIGSHTVDLLLSRGYNVRVLDSLVSPVHLDNIKPDYLSKDVEFVMGDVRDKAVWESALNNIDAVFHLAAYQDYLPDFSKFFHVNTVGTANLYEVIVEHNLSIGKIIVASSQAIYGEGKYRCKVHGIQYPYPRSNRQLEMHQWDILCEHCDNMLELDETDEMHINPHNSYSMSKYSQEMIGLVLGKRYEIPTVGMRYSIVQGTRQSFRNAYSGVLRIFAMQALSGHDLTAYEDGKQIRDYVNVKDVACANIIALEDKRTDYCSYNVGGGSQVTVNEFGNIMLEAVGNDAIQVVSNGEYRFGDTRHIISNTNALRELGWKPKSTVETSVKEYINWAHNHPDFGDYVSSAMINMRELGTVRGSTLK